MTLWLPVLLTNGCGTGKVDLGSPGARDDGPGDTVGDEHDDTASGGGDGDGGTDDTSSPGGGTTTPFNQCPPSKVSIPGSVDGALSIAWNMVPLATHTFELRSGVAFLQCGSREPRILLATDDIDCADISTTVGSELATIEFDPSGATSFYLFWNEGLGQQASFSTTSEMPFSSTVDVPAAETWIEGETVSGSITGDYSAQLAELMSDLGFEKDDSTVLDAKFSLPFCGEID